MSISGAGIISGAGVISLGVQYNLTVQSVSHGSTAPGVGVHSYFVNAQVPVQANADSGWALDHWMLDGNDVGNANPYTVTMDTNHTIYCVFYELPPVYTITVYNPQYPYYNSVGVDGQYFGDAEWVIYLPAGEYSLDAIIQVGTFDSWGLTGGVSVASQSQTTTLTVTGDGNVTLNVV